MLPLLENAGTMTVVSWGQTGHTDSTPGAITRYPAGKNRAKNKNFQPLVVGPVAAVSMPN